MGLILTQSVLGHHMNTVPQVGQSLSSQISQSTPMVFVIDPDSTVHESMELLLICQGRRLKTFGSAEDFLAWPLELVPSCLLLEASLPGISGMELQRRVAREHPHIPIIFLTAKGDIFTAVEAMKAGAVEFLMKPFQDKDLLSAVREGLERSGLVLARKAEKCALQNCFASLSPREQQVMALVSSGLSNKHVGGELGISEITVKAHRGQAMRKMRAASLADLVKMAGKLGLARRREATMLRDQADRAAYLGAQINGTYGLVSKAAPASPRF
jgi:FixJ family two-component response regulator